MRAAIQPAAVNVNRCEWRQRSPAAMIAGHTPRDPGGSPDAVRHPHPAATRHLPAAIMERRPTPTVGGLPIPTAIGVSPMAVIAVRLPGAIDDDAPRLPAPSDAVHLKPGSIRSQVRIEIVHFLRRIADIVRRRFIRRRNVRWGYHLVWLRNRLLLRNRLRSGSGHRRWRSLGGGRRWTRFANLPVV